MERRCSREHAVQKTRVRPASTDVVQVSGTAGPAVSAGARVPHR